MPDRFTNDFVVVLAGTYIASLQQAIDLISTMQPNLAPKEVVQEAERQADMALRASIQIMAPTDDIEPGDRLEQIKMVATTLPGGEILLAMRRPPYAEN